MTAPINEDKGILREWTPLTSLLQKLPSKIQNGLFFQDLNITCIDAVPEFIAIGTNHGMIYWYDRETGELQKLKCENVYCSITCIQVISTVDFMVAAGSNLGTVTIFQIPKKICANVPESLKPKTKQQIERFSVTGLHQIAISAIEWSKNGMKLFSGDQSGLVVLTEIDFYMHLSKSYELVNEKQCIVQLSYYQSLLLLSTIFRTVLVDMKQKNKVIQVGQMERKTLGKLGAIFFKKPNQPKQPVIYAARPGLRIWEADYSGTVLKTLIFKDTIKTGTQIHLLNPAPIKTKRLQMDPSFGTLKTFSEDLLVTFDSEVIYVINPTTISITSVVTRLRKIIDVACLKDEIFVLEGERNIIRIAYRPEISQSNIDSDNIVNPLAALAKVSKPVTSGLMELTSRLSESSILPSLSLRKITPTSLIQSMSLIPSATIGMDESTIGNAEEALEIPPILPLDISTPLITDINAGKKHVSFQGVSDDRKTIFKKIAQQSFEDVVFTPERTRSSKKALKSLHKELDNHQQMLNSCDSDSSKSSSSLSRQSENSATVIKTNHSSLLTVSVDNEVIFQSDRNVESIQRDVENKEKLLSDILNFDLSDYKSKSQTEVEKKVNQVDEEENIISDFKQLTEVNSLQDLDQSILSKRLDEPWNDKSNNSVENIVMESTENAFNDLSKEFVMSKIEDDDDDWVLIG